MDGSVQQRRKQEHLDELGREVAEAVHRRLLHAYRGDEPLESMEAELGKILSEIVQHED